MFGGGTPKKGWLLTWPSHNKGKTIAGVVTPPMVGANVSDAGNQGDNRSHKCMNSGRMNPCQLQGMDPRGGAKFDENGPNLTEDISFVVGTILVGIEGPEEVQSSGIASKVGERLEIISSWSRAAVDHNLAKANDGSTNQGPVLKGRDSTDQLIIRLVLCNHGRPRTIRAEWCSFITKRERFWVKLSAKVIESFTDSWINPEVAGLPLRRHSVTG